MYYQKRRSEESKGPYRKPPAETLTERALLSWGINPEKNYAHRSFFNDYLKFATECVTNGSTVICISDATTAKPHQDVTIFLKEILEKELNEMNEEGLMIVQDSLKERISDNFAVAPPYEWNQSKRNYQMKSIYSSSRITDNDLDPFVRFSYARRDRKEVLKEQWLDDGNFPAVLLRGILAHHACHHETCFNCHKPCLEWNQEHRNDTYWRMIICRNCSSIYELKASFSDHDKVQNRLSNGTFDGGNYFKTYHGLQRGLPSTAKQFYAIILIDPIIAAGERQNNGVVQPNKYWKVLVAEVVDVTPQLKARSFDRQDDEVRIYSRLIVRPRINHTWFDIPYFECDSKAMVEEALERI